MDKKFELDYGSVWIQDNFLDIKDLDKFQDDLSKLEFEYIQYAYRDNPDKEFSFGNQFAYLINQSPMESTLELDKIKSRLLPLLTLEEDLKDCSIARVHLSKVTHLDQRFFHIDSSEGDVHVAVMFLNNKWKDEWDGDLVMKNKDEEIRITPTPGRLVIFNGRIVHRGGIILTPDQDKYTLVCKLCKDESIEKLK